MAGNLIDRVMRSTLLSKIPRGVKAIALGSSLLGVGAAFGYLFHEQKDFNQNYYSAEQIQKRIDIEEQQAAKELATQREKEAADGAALAAQEKAGAERMTPEIKEKIFARTNLERAACFPHGYGFEARMDERGKIVYFQESLTFDRNDSGSNWKNWQMAAECMDEVKLGPYWEKQKLPQLPSEAHIGVLKDIYVLCATGVSESEQALVKDGVFTYTFEIAAAKAAIQTHDSYVSYWSCVNSSVESPIFGQN